MEAILTVQKAELRTATETVLIFDANMESEIFRSYLTNRQQFVQIDTFNSSIINVPDCSVVQGGKMSGLLYSIYTNEVTQLHKLMKNDIFTKIIKSHKLTFKNINH